MIRVILQGGLGNQMFEYAAAYAAARRAGQPLVLDSSFFEIYAGREWCRPYELGIFRLHEGSAFVSRHRLEVKLLPKIAQWCRKHRVPRLGKYVFLPEGLGDRKNMVLFGYFPDYHVFDDCREELLQAFEFRGKANTINLELLNSIGACESVAVHIRRGDYLNNTNAGVFWHPTVDWYREAIEAVSKQLQNVRLFFFSDDIAWVKEQFSNMTNAVFVDVNHGKEAFNDLRLMSRCKHNIIANSTFSWWAAWLNENPDKMVIAPAKYYMNEAANERYRKNMILPQWKTM